MHCKSALVATATAASMLISTAAFAGGAVYTGYGFALPIPIPDAQADYGIIDDAPIIKGGPIISDTVPNLPANATAYIFVTPRHYGPDGVDVYIGPNGLHRRWSPTYLHGRHQPHYYPQLP